MPNFNNEVEAAECLRNYENQPRPFCPIINDFCRHDCICFKEAHLSVYYEHGRWNGPRGDQDKVITWRVDPSSCTHVLIMGDIQISQ